MESKEITDLLDNGWIYIETNDEDYFRKVILNKLKKRDILYYEDKLFIKKSLALYRILKNIGMNLSTYDTIIIFALKKEEDEIKVNLYSLRSADKLDDISKSILKNIHHF